MEDLYLSDAFFSSVFVLGNSSVIANPTLKPEIMDRIELSFQKRFGDKTKLNITCYYNQSKNLVNTVFVNSKMNGSEYIYYQLDNRFHRNSRGAQLNIITERFSNLLIKSSLSWSTINERSGSESYLLGETITAQKSMDNMFYWITSINYHIPNTFGLLNNTDVELFPEFKC